MKRGPKANPAPRPIKWVTFETARLPRPTADHAQRQIRWVTFETVVRPAPRPTTSQRQIRWVTFETVWLWAPRSSKMWPNEIKNGFCVATVSNVVYLIFRLSRYGWVTSWVGWWSPRWSCWRHVPSLLWAEFPRNSQR